MEIKDLENRRIKISKCSITCKEEGKTCRVIRGIKKWSESSPKEQFEFSRALQMSGIWGYRNKNLLDNVFLSNKELYYVNDLEYIRKNEEMLSRIPKESAEFFQDDVKHLEEVREIAEIAKNYMNVINAYVI